MTILFYIALALFLTVCVLLTIIVLLQESKSMGLGASFGGDANGSLFGTSTADVLKTITAWFIAIFMAGSFLLSVFSSLDLKKVSSTSNLQINTEPK